MNQVLLDAQTISDHRGLDVCFSTKPIEQDEKKETDMEMGNVILLGFLCSILGLLPLYHSQIIEG